MGLLTGLEACKEFGVKMLIAVAHIGGNIQGSEASRTQRCVWKVEQPKCQQVGSQWGREGFLLQPAGAGAASPWADYTQSIHPGGGQVESLLI